MIRASTEMMSRVRIIGLVIVLALLAGGSSIYAPSASGARFFEYCDRYIWRSMDSWDNAHVCIKPYSPYYFQNFYNYNYSDAMYNNDWYRIWACEDMYYAHTLTEWLPSGLKVCNIGNVSKTYSNYILNWQIQPVVGWFATQAYQDFQYKYMRGLAYAPWAS